MAYRSLITSHENKNLSGVAKFNNRLSKLLGIECIGLEPAMLLKAGPVLLSLKMKDNGRDEIDAVTGLFNRLMEEKIQYDLFFHSFDGLEIEYLLVENAEKIFCGNLEIYHVLEGQNKETISAWCPSLVDLRERLEEKDINIFSFGMAHKLQLKYYMKLKEILDSFQVDYTIWISTAFHEKAKFGDFSNISEQLIELFDNNIQFLGFLSDCTVDYFMAKATLFTAFFEKGVRANNTSVYAAMEKGCPLLTNTDHLSPQWMEHGKNILDIHRLMTEDIKSENLKNLAIQARIDSKRNASWGELVNLIQSR